jgi:hypothetical protein
LSPIVTAGLPAPGPEAVEELEVEAVLELVVEELLLPQAARTTLSITIAVTPANNLPELLHRLTVIRRLHPIVWFVDRKSYK